ncbi:MAG: hypothetical protein GPJ07_08095 [Microcystis aeruginosa G13-07]|nr:hypothetical protein [Microcystis aeruginosa G13-11]NCS06562.1 hypothetical protein [Microcystis aeruginosa G13-07]
MTRVLSGKKLGMREVGCGVWEVGGNFHENPNPQPLTDYCLLITDH